MRTALLLMLLAVHSFGATPTPIPTSTIKTGFLKVPSAGAVPRVSAIQQSDVSNLPASMAVAVFATPTITDSYFPVACGDNRVKNSTMSEDNGVVSAPAFSTSNVINPASGTTVISMVGADLELGDGLNDVVINSASLTISGPATVKSLGVSGSIYAGGPTTIAGGGILKATVGSESGGAIFLSVTDSSGSIDPSLYFTGGTSGDGRPGIHIDANGENDSLVWAGAATINVACSNSDPVTFVPVSGCTIVSRGRLLYSINSTPVVP